MNSGERQWKCEISSIDTSLLLCGVLTARQHFADSEIQDLATKIYERVDWPWMLNGGKTLSMGWHPESGFLDARWSHYCELMMIYLLALGSPTHPDPGGNLEGVDAAHGQIFMALNISREMTRCSPINIRRPGSISAGSATPTRTISRIR